MTPPAELMLTISPARRARISGRASRVIRARPKKFASNTAFASASLTSSTAPMTPVPTLLTSTSSRPPVASATARTHAAADSSEVTSSGTRS